MKKPNLRSIKGPNRAAKYAKLMKAYRKYQSSLVKSPKGEIVKSVKGKLAKTPNNKGVISETANFSKDKVTAKGTRTGRPGKPIKGLLEGRKGVKGQQYKAPKIPKSARKTSRTGRFVDRVTSQQKQSAKGLGKRLNKLNRLRKTNKVLREGNPSKILKATEKAQRTLKITRGARSLRGVLNPKNFKNLSSIKTLGAGIALNALADVGTRRLSRSISNRIRKNQGKNTETQKEYNDRIKKLKGLSRSELKALKDKERGKTVKTKTPIVSAGSNNKKRNKKKIVKQVTNKTSTPTTNKTKVEKKVEKKVTPIVDKKVTPIVKTKTTVTPTVTKPKYQQVTQKQLDKKIAEKKKVKSSDKLKLGFRRTKGEGIEGKSDGYRGDTRITKRLKKSGFTETRLAKLREKNAAFQKAKRGGKEAMKAYRKKYPKK